MLFPALVQPTDSRLLLYGASLFSERLYLAVTGSTSPLASLSFQFLYMTEESYALPVKHVLTVGLAMKRTLHVSVSVTLLSTL